MLESSEMSYNIFERVQKCWTVFPTLLMIFSMFERFKQTFNILYKILSNFRTSGRSTWKKEHYLLSLTNWMFKSQISSQIEMLYEDSLEKNWIKWNLVKEGRILTICMRTNGCFGTSFSSYNLWWRQQKAEIHFRLAIAVFK